MRFDWPLQQIEWYERAVRWTHFDAFLYDACQEYLSPDETICDLGCGIGYMSRYLCQKGYPVTAIDRSENAIRYLRQLAVQEHFPNLSIHCVDWTTLPKDQTWDTLLMCFAGFLEVDELPFKKRLITFTNERHLSNYVSDAPSPYDYEAQRLAAKRIDPSRYTWHYRHLTGEFGQPLRSLEEAREYFATYRYDVAPHELEQRLIATGDSEFPWYFPHKKEVGLYVIERRG
ncbi:MAG: class I SAM-dependent methyltransferase [Lachnospiraceae bacterium]|nr:class I SAM-dependent methyltransferase [Lachnospiraceae bacterium]